MEKDCAWLAGGDYGDFVRSLSFSDPRLRQRDPKAQTQRIPFTDDGARVVKLSLENGTFARTAEFDEPASLEAHFRSTASLRGRRNIYVVEGLGPCFASVLGERFSLHPSFFVEHERVVVHNLNWMGESDGVQLPSVIQSRGHLEMKYYEVVTFDRKPTSFRWVCAATGRHIGVSRDFKWDNSPDEMGNYLNVGVVRRKCGVWSRRTEGGGWDCLVLCDPPVKSVRTGDEYKKEYPVKTCPYQGGYLDFVPEEEQIRVAREGRYCGPPRTSMLEDLSFYLETHSRLVDIAEPESVNVFVKKIVASHFLKQTEHLRATLSAVQRGLTRKQDLAKMPMNKVEALWSDMQGWERRMGEYLEDLEGIMLQIGIPLSHPVPPATFLHELASFTRDRTVLRDQLVAILLAGRDTTAASLSWTLYELGRHPEVVSKLRAEIIEQVGLDRAPTYADLKNMKYLQNVMNETLRLYPVVPFNVRLALRDTTLPVGGGSDGTLPLAICKDTPIGYSTLVMQRREDLYPPVSETFAHPSEFSPERWFNWQPKPWTYIPFNGGPRICIGQQFALTEMSYTLCRLFQNFERIESYMDAIDGGDPTLKAEIVLQPGDGVKVAFWRADKA